jgi:DNA-directed RNA polymerase specialized sigma24 family protein
LDVTDTDTPRRTIRSIYSIGSFRLHFPWRLHCEGAYVRALNREIELIAPLTKRRKDDTPYLRSEDVEMLLPTLARLPRGVLLERARIRDRKNPDYIPSECLLYFVRASRLDNSDAWFERLYKVLVERVLRAVPRAEAGGNTASLVNDTIRNAVFDRFVEMVAQDRRQPDDKLDFFEVRFDLAVKRLRLDAQERAWREENRSDALDEDSGETGSDDLAATALDPFESNIFSDPLFRDRVYLAIDQLPPEQSRTVHLLLLGWPIHSNDPAVMTIAKALGCSDRSVRNHRKRALKTLAALFNPGDHQ